MLELGQMVTAINRHGEEVKGELTAVFLDESRRKVARIVMEKAEGEQQSNVANVDFATINFSEEYKEQYLGMLAEVKRISGKGNDLVKETVEAYNALVAEAENETIGKPYAKS